MRVFLVLVVQPFVAAGLAFVSSPLMEWSGRAIYGGIDVDQVYLAITQAFGAGATSSRFVARSCGGRCLGTIPSLLGTLLAGVGLRDRGAGAPCPLRVVSRTGWRCRILGGLGESPASVQQLAGDSRLTPHAGPSS
jgi:hypothetical protein